MKRRDFIIKSAAIGIIPFIPFEIGGTVSDDVGDTVEYKGITLRWTGWMSFPDCVKLVGRWSGTDKKSVSMKDFYHDSNYQASYPGGESKYFMGATHDITMKENQILPTLDVFINNPELPLKLKKETLDRVKKLIDENKSEIG